MRAPAQTMPRVATQPQAQINRTAPIANVRPEVSGRSSAGRTRSFESRNAAPSVAFGGSAINNSNRNAVVNAQDARRFSNDPSTAQFATRSNDRRMHAPGEVSRSWDRGRMHSWNHHNYRWYGGNWVIIDSDPYFYGGYAPDYGYDDTVTYSSPGYVNESSESLAASVQDQLTRLGYSPGPVDGVIGAQTRDAIADFQNDRRLPVTGQIDTALLRALGL